MKQKEMRFDNMGIGVEFRINKVSMVKYMKIPKCEIDRRDLMANQFGTTERNAVCMNFSEKGNLSLIQPEKVVFVED